MECLEKWRDGFKAGYGADDGFSQEISQDYLVSWYPGQFSRLAYSLKPKIQPMWTDLWKFELKARISLWNALFLKRFT